MKLTIILTKPPYGDMRAVEALRYAYSAAEIEVKLHLVLVDGGVLMAKKGQSTGSSGYEDVVMVLKDIIDLGGNVIAEKGSLKEFDLDAGDLIDDVQVVHGHEISLHVKEADKAMIF